MKVKVLCASTIEEACDINGEWITPRYAEIKTLEDLVAISKAENCAVICHFHEVEPDGRTKIWIYDADME